MFQQLREPVLKGHDLKSCPDTNRALAECFSSLFSRAARIRSDRQEENLLQPPRLSNSAAEAGIAVVIYDQSTTIQGLPSLDCRGVARDPYWPPITISVTWADLLLP